jgi:hypothetical protein
MLWVEKGAEMKMLFIYGRIWDNGLPVIGLVVFMGFKKRSVP